MYYPVARPGADHQAADAHGRGPRPARPRQQEQRGVYVARRARIFLWHGIARCGFMIEWDGMGLGGVGWGGMGWDGTGWGGAGRGGAGQGGVGLGGAGQGRVGWLSLCPSVRSPAPPAGNVQAM